MANPLVSDRNLEFLLYELLEADKEPGAERETFDLVLASARKLAREVLFPAYKPMDDEPPRLENGQVKVHRAMREIWPRMFDLGIANATRPADVGGQELPLTLATAASHYLMAANAAAFGYAGLTSGAAHLIEAFGDEALRRDFMPKMYSGEWSGTMALTEPHAGSSLADVRTRARPTAAGHYLIDGNKVFISGGDQDFTSNIVHLTLARIEGAPEGIKGVSLFAIPKKRLDGADNDCASASVFHKMGWKGLPSIALNFGERGDCHGWLVGQAGRGINHMFQMMNEARLMVGLNAISTASAAYLESLEYARTRPQGRKPGETAGPQVPIIEHADVRRMLLRQKAIVEGGLALLLQCAVYAGRGDAESKLLLDLLTPIAKSFPSEKGFESNALAVQIHGGYGYTSEYLPESWLRDQKLNTIHEGTTGIQALDLLGRKAMAGQGAALLALKNAIDATCTKARAAGVPERHIEAVERTTALVGEVTMELASKGLSGDREGMLLHSTDYLELASTLAVSWMWLAQAAVAQGKAGDFYAGKLAAASYWLDTELPRCTQLATLIRSGEESYLRIPTDGF